MCASTSLHITLWRFLWAWRLHFTGTLDCKACGLVRGTVLSYGLRLIGPLGQVVALFIVGTGEYVVVWLCTDWEKEVERGIERNNVGGSED